MIYCAIALAFYLAVCVVVVMSALRLGAIREAQEMKFLMEMNQMKTTELVIGETYHVPSGMGGAFQVAYEGLVDGYHQFKNLHEDWNKGPFAIYRLTNAGVEARITP